MKKQTMLKKREQIVEKHMEALLRELQRSGFPDAVGVAGGVVLNGQCHVFFVMDDNVVRDGVPADGQEFLGDVARVMLGLPEAVVS